MSDETNAIIKELMKDLGAALGELDMALKETGSENNDLILASVSPVVFHLLAVIKVG